MGVSMREYARLRGLDKEAVRRAVIDGRLSESVTRNGSRYDIDPQLADKEWRQNTDPSKQNNTKGPKLAGGASYSQARAVKEM